MKGKYIATVETLQGEEMACALESDPFKHVGTLEEAKAFKDAELKSFPEMSFRIYRLKEVKDGGA